MKIKSTTKVEIRPFVFVKNGAVAGEWGGVTFSRGDHVPARMPINVIDELKAQGVIADEPITD